MAAGTGGWLGAHRPRGDQERLDLERVGSLCAAPEGPFDRRLPLHLTGSAVVFDPATGQVLLRWHERQGAWLQVGGHGDPGEVDPLEVALREGREETGLRDLAPWPHRESPEPVHVVIVPVVGRGDEPAHEHADVRYLFVTGSPGQARAETAAAQVRWVPLADAIANSPGNLAETLTRIADLLESEEGSGSLRT